MRMKVAVCLGIIALATPFAIAQSVRRHSNTNEQWRQQTRHTQPIATFAERFGLDHSPDSEFVQSAHLLDGSSQGEGTTASQVQSDAQEIGSIREDDLRENVLREEDLQDQNEVTQPAPDFDASFRVASGPEIVPTEEVCQTLAVAAEESNLPVPFLARLIWQESGFNQRAVSSAGAQGVAQFMPAVAAERGLENPFDARTALPASAKFLESHVRYFGNIGLAAAAYNAGARRVTAWLAKRGKLPNETRQYVRIITGNEPEKWAKPGEIEMPTKMPARHPCVGIAGLSHSESTQTIEVKLEEPIAKMVADAKSAGERMRHKRVVRLARFGKSRFAARQSRYTRQVAQADGLGAAQKIKLASADGTIARSSSKSQRISNYTSARKLTGGKKASRKSKSRKRLRVAQH